MLAVGDTRSVNVTLKVGALTETVSVQADATLVETRDIGVGTRRRAGADRRPAAQRPRARNQLDRPGGRRGRGRRADRRPAVSRARSSISVAGGTGNSTHVSGGRRLQQRSAEQHRQRDAVSRRAPGVQRRERRALRAVRHVDRRDGERRHAVGHEHLPRQRVRLRPPSHVQRDSLLRAHGERRAGARRRAEARISPAARSAGRSSRTSCSSSAACRSRTTASPRWPTTRSCRRAEVRSGDFRRIMSAACRGGTARTLGAPFVNNQIDPALYHPISLKIMNMVPVAGPALDPDGCGRYVARDAQRQRRAAVHRRASTTRCRRKHGSSSATSTRKYLHAPLFDHGQPEPARWPRGNGRGNDARMSDVRRAAGTTSSRRTCSARRAFSYPAHGDAPRAGRRHARRGRRSA